MELKHIWLLIAGSPCTSFNRTNYGIETNIRRIS